MPDSKLHKIFLALIFGFFSLCILASIYTKDYDIVRYRLTLIVNDNGKQFAGSSVIQVRPIYPSRPNLELPLYTGVKGEAVVIDLKEKGVLFGLLKSENDDDYAYNIIFKSYLGNFELKQYRKGRAYAIDRLGPKKDLDINNLPTLVHFQDISNPDTMEKVDPNNLEKVFGKGVKLVSATIEMVDEPVTMGIEKYLKWMAKVKESAYSGEDQMKAIDVKNIFGSEFSQGIYVK